MKDFKLILEFILTFLLMFSWVLLFLMFKKKSCIQNNSSNHVDLILPKLFLGNISSSLDKKFIKKNNIEVIFNCTNTLKNEFENSNIIYHRIPVDDSLEEYDIELMKDYLPNYVKLIDKYLSENKAILVHCYAGRQRSAILIAAYLLYKYNYSIEKAYEFIISKRPEAFHYGKSFNFHRSLLDFKNKIN